MQNDPSSRSRSSRLHARGSARRLIEPFLMLLGVILGGTMGYRLLEGWSLLDAFYMTVITMTTVGFGEVAELTTRGRVFTVLLIFLSIGVGGYAVSRVTAFIMEGEINRMFELRRMDQRITRLKNHIILCGAGRVGRHIAQELFDTNTPFVVIEENPDNIAALEHIGDILYIRDDATQNEVLQEARIDHARGLITAIGDDKTNLFIVLSGRSLNPDLRIVTRLIEDDNLGKLHMAGATEVVSTSAIAGQRLASVMIHPTVVNFLNEMMHVPDTTLRMNEIAIDTYPHLSGQTLGQAHIGQKTGMLVVAVRKSDGTFKFNPGAATHLDRGDILIVIGTPEQQEKLKNLA